MSAIFSLKRVRKVVVTLLVSGALFVGVSAQQGPQLRPIHELDLETSILLAKDQSREMRLLRLRTESASYALKSALSAIRTNVDLELTVPRYSETMRQFEDASGISYYPVKQTTMSGSLIINQPLPTDGRLFIRSGAQSVVDINDNSRNAQMSSSIGLSQPIAAIFGYNTNRLAFKQAKLNYEMTLKQLKRAELDLVYSVTQSFYNVISTRERVKIAQMTAARQKESYELAQSKFKAGLIREVEALQMEVDYTRESNSLDGAQVDYASRLEAFKESLGIDMQDSITLKDDMTLMIVTVDADKAVALAMLNRLELRENAIQIELQEMSVRRQKAAGKISGNIDLTYNFLGLDRSQRDDPVRMAFENSWNNLIDRKGALGASVTVSVPLLDWGGNRARVRSSQSTLKQYQIQDEAEKISIEREMRSNVSQLQRNLRTFVALEKSVVIAEKGFEISRQRYSDGDIDSQAIALERERLNNAYVTRLEAYISYKLLLSDIMRKTFFDFEKGESLID